MDQGTSKTVGDVRNRRRFLEALLLTAGGVAATATLSACGASRAPDRDGTSWQAAAAPRLVQARADNHYSNVIPTEIPAVRTIPVTSASSQPYAAKH